MSAGDRPRIEAVLQELEASGSLPAGLVEQIKAQVRALADGQELLVVSAEASLTTTQAAQLIGCSRPHLVKMCERGEVEWHFVGRDRRITGASVVAYLERRAVDRGRAQGYVEGVAAQRDVSVAARAGLSLDEARRLGL